MTLTLTLDWVTLHTVVHHSSTSTWMPNFIEIKANFLWMDKRTDARTDGQLKPALLGRLYRRVDLTNTMVVCKTLILVQIYWNHSGQYLTTDDKSSVWFHQCNIEIERTDRCCSETESVTAQICSGRNQTEPNHTRRSALAAADRRGGRQVARRHGDN